MKKAEQVEPINTLLLEQEIVKWKNQPSEMTQHCLFLVKTGGEKVAEIRNEYGGCSIERCINFERREGYMENMRVEVKTDAMLSPEKTKEITSIIEKTIKEIRKTVEKW